VVGFSGAYHTILGRPCYAKFMAVPNYTYLKMKMPGPNGIITVGSSIEHAFDCFVECVEHAEALALDKFSKWVEVRHITNLMAEQAVTFFTDIVYRFGVPNYIIIDNGSQFTGRKFLEFCDKFHIRVDREAVEKENVNELATFAKMGKNT
jgi:hypothetical protein